MNKNLELATLRRMTADKPGTRGPHLNLFSGGLPKQKAAPAPTLDEEVTSFAEKRKLSEPATAVLRIVVKHHTETGGETLMADTYEIAKKSGLSYADAVKAKDALLHNGVLRFRADNAFGLDGLIPGNPWTNRHGGRR